MSVSEASNDDDDSSSSLQSSLQLQLQKLIPSSSSSSDSSTEAEAKAEVEATTTTKKSEASNSKATTTKSAQTPTTITTTNNVNHFSSSSSGREREEENKNKINLEEIEIKVKEEAASSFPPQIPPPPLLIYEYDQNSSKDVTELSQSHRSGGGHNNYSSDVDSGKPLSCASPLVVPPLSQHPHGHGHHHYHRSHSNKAVENHCYSWLLNNVHNVKERRLSGGGEGDDSSTTDVSSLASHSSSNSSTSSSSSSESSTFPSLPIPPPPDGGWGWVVVFGAFMVLFICDGLSYCFGVLYHELLVHFGESRSKTSLVGGIFFGVSMVLGPFASAMTTRFGCRKMTIIGGLMSSFGFFLSYFATSLNMLFFTFGIVVATGFSFCYVTSTVIVHFYFDKRRSLATGLAMCGTGLGTFTFAPMMEFLIAEYGLRGLFLIMSGISLNLVVAGVVFKTLRFTDQERCQYYLAEFEKLPNGRECLELGRMRLASESTEFGVEVELLDDIYEPRNLSTLNLPTFIAADRTAVGSEHSPEILREALKNSKNPQLTFQRYIKNAYFRSTEKHLDEKNVGERNKKDNVLNAKSNSISTENLYRKENVGSSVDVLNKKNSLPCNQLPLLGGHHSTMKSDGSSNVIKGQGQGHDLSKRLSFLGISNTIRSRSISKLFSGMGMGKHNAMGMQLLLYRTDIFYRRQLNKPTATSSALRDNTCLMGTSCPELADPRAFMDTSTTKSKRSKPKHQCQKFIDELYKIILTMSDFSLFKNVFFTLFAISNFIFYFWNDVPYMFSSDNAVEKGISTNDASFLLSIVGITSAVGQLFFGFMGDLNINLINVFAIALVISGVFNLLIPLMQAFWSMATMYALFGLFVSVNFPFCSVLLVNYLGVDQLTNAYGLLMMIQGIANCLGPPFAGWISDMTHSYDWAFYLSGVFSGMSGLIMYVIMIPKCRVEQVPKHPPMELEIESGGNLKQQQQQHLV